MTFCQLNTQPNDSPTVFERHLVSPAPEDARGNHITGTLASWAKSGNPTWSRWSSKLTRKMTTTFTHLTKAAIHHCQKKRKEKKQDFKPDEVGVWTPYRYFIESTISSVRLRQLLASLGSALKIAVPETRQYLRPATRGRSIAHQNAPRRTVSPAITVSDSCLALYCFFLGSTPTSSRIRPSNSSGGSVI